MQDYNTYSDIISISFNCPRCSKKIGYTINHPARPNWEGDTVAASQNIDDDDFDCPYCKMHFNVETVANIYYGEIRLRAINHGSQSEITDFEIIEKENIMKEKFNEWISGQVKTQYGDMKGIAYIDGHEGPGEAIKMLQSSGVNTDKYAVLGFQLYGLEPIGEHIHAVAYIVDKRIISAKGSVENLDYNTDVEEFDLDNFDWDVLKRYIKRLSIGFVLPEHLRDMNKE